MASENNTPEKLAARARQLVAKKNQGVNWGVVSTISSRLKGCPFGNVVSFSDGAPGSGIPYFYLSARDRSLTDVAKDSSISLTVCDYALVTRGQITPNTPCGKLTLSGKLKLVEAKPKEAISKDATDAKTALEKHLNLKGSHEENEFKIYKLDIEKLFLIDWFGEAKEVPRDEYLKYVKA